MQWSTFDCDEHRPKPVLRMVIDAHISAVTECGKTPDGMHMNYMIGGGEFMACGADDEIIKGQVMPGGADYFRERADGVGVLNAMYSLKSDQGQVVNLHNTGLYVTHEEGKALEADGGWPLPKGLYRSACRPVFTAPEGELHWLNNNVFTGLVEYPTAANVIIRIYQLVD